MNLPASIKHPETFCKSAPPAFDGVFDWSWMQECWPNQNDKPMDIDAFKERRGQSLFIETKNVGVPVPRGQMIGFESLHSNGNIAVMFVWGKTEPEYGEFWFPNSKARQEWRGRDEAIDLVRRWYQWADRGGK